ncbi:MAG: hypothetical protein HFH88_10860 [Lachnospiraceae bacterium]|nr:hypothetical protein [Lachnospiraceae bacterium]
MAIGAAHGTALYEYDKTGTGTVNGSKTFQRMNSALHKITTLSEIYDFANNTFIISISGNPREELLPGVLSSQLD